MPPANPLALDPVEPVPSFHDSESELGERGAIPLVGRTVVAAKPLPALDGLTALAAPRPASAYKASKPAELLHRGDSDRRYLYWLLLLVLIPLAWSTFDKNSDDGNKSFLNRLQQTVKDHPEIEPKLEALPENASLAQLMSVLPNHKLDGALLPSDTMAHWGMALLSAAGFLVAVLLLFPLGHAKWYHMAAIALFTGTIGIIALLAFQWVAINMSGRILIPRSAFGLLITLVQLIGLSYRCALDPSSNVILSALGFTAGVGFCEEVCKALPMVLKARRSGFASWRGAMLWGLMSGVGFGVSEGITYSSDYYNGIFGAEIYWVRFVSCVGLHAIWAAAVGVTIFRRQDTLRGGNHPLEWIMRMATIVIVPMILHGLYDTLLKQKHDLYALGIALVSFAWLAIQIEWAKRQFDGEGGLAFAGR